MVTLPYDVLDGISELIRAGNEPEDFKTLYIMSCVSRLMLQLCRKYLFQTVILPPRGCDSVVPVATNPHGLAQRRFIHHSAMFRVKTLERLVESSPDILTNVRKLFIYSDQTNYDDNALCSLLDKFQNVQSLTIDTGDVSGWPLWNSLPSSYQRSLMGLVHRSSLHYLCFDSFQDIPADMLLPLGKLVNLSVETTSFSFNGSTFSPGSTSDRFAGALELRELLVSGCVQNILHLFDENSTRGHPIIDPTALRSLGICPYECPKMTWDPKSLLKKISHLEQLMIANADINYPNYLTDIVHGLHPYSFTTLVLFRYDIIYPITSLFAAWRPMPSEIIYDLKFDSLQTLQIHLEMNMIYEAPVLEDLLQLDQIIGRPQFPSLAKLEFEVCHNNPPVPSSIVDTWRAVPTSHFRRISADHSIDLIYSFTEKESE